MRGQAVSVSLAAPHFADRVRVRITSDVGGRRWQDPLTLRARSADTPRMATSRRPKGEGSLFQQPNGSWVGRILFEDPVTGLIRKAQVTGKTKSGASSQLKAMRTRIEQGVSAKDDGVPFGVFTSRWVESSLAASDRKASTKALYAGLARTHILGSELGKTPLKRLRPTTVERFVTQLRAKGLSDSSVRQIYTVARAVGDAAVRDGSLGRNPFAAIRRPKVAPTEANYLSPAEVTALLSAAQGTRYGVLFELLVNTGLRRGEALALRWQDVDLKDRTLRVRGTLARVDGDLQVTDTKSAKSRRTVPLSAPAVDVLTRVKHRTAFERRRAAQLWVDSGFVFVTDVGQPCDPRNALRALRVAAKAAGLDRVGLHTLRHSAASLMLSNGVPITVVSQILGHSGISITVDVYGHVAPDVSRDAVEVLATALGSSGGA